MILKHLVLCLGDIKCRRIVHLVHELSGVRPYFESRHPEEEAYRTLLLRFGIHKVPRVAYYTQNHLGTSQRGWPILYGCNSGIWSIDLYKRYVSRLIVLTTKPTLRNSDSLPGPKLHSIVPAVLNRLLTVIANISLDMRQPPEIMRPVVGAMASGHNRIIVDEPTCTHRPRGVLVLASEAKKQFHNS